ncbi:MAG: Zn-dependent protease with chaperone function, partial [Nodularia sp. (in: cyanobacteria)]|nr:Zn-dependent protease with chaperone function [Nodularia sp. (in: cyanobacteria)]
MHSDAELSLEAGLVALKQENYQVAIAKLTPVASSQEDATANLQARVGLVMAYARIGQISKATALCHTLTQSQNTQVKEWAELALTHLTKRKKSSKVSTNSATGLGHLENAQNSAASKLGQSVVAAQKPKDPVAENTSDRNSSAVKSGSLRNTAIPSVEYQNTTIAEAPASNTNIFFGSTSYTQTPPSSIYWRQGKRAKVWQPLRKPKLIPLRFLAVGTFVALFWLLREIVNLLTGLINFALVKLPYLEPLQFLYRNP